jgi:hypothetical protein
VNPTESTNCLPDCEPASGDRCAPEAGSPSAARGIAGIGLAVAMVLAPWALLAAVALLVWRLFD